MSENNKKETNDFSLAKIITLLKRNLIFILIIVILSMFFGVLYTKLKKPTFTATESVSYDADVILDGSDKTDNKSSVTMMKLYFPTVVTYCQTGGVLDRADVYYEKYLDFIQNEPEKSLKDFLAFVDDGQVEYQPSKEYQRKHYSLSDVSSSIIDEEMQFVFNVSIKDKNENAIREKLRILVIAFDAEIEYSFGGVVSNIKEYVDSEHQITISSNVSMVRNIIVALLLGVVLALVLVYVRYLSDKTIKGKEELEALTGSHLLALINKNEEKKDGTKKSK